VSPCQSPPRLESELPGKLDNSVIERAVDLTEVRGVYVQGIRYGEVGVIENVECFEAQFETESLFESCSLDKRRIDIPIAGAVDRGKTQTADRTCGWIREERRTGFAIICDPSRINNQRQSGFRIMKQPYPLLQLGNCLRRIYSVV